MMGKGNGKGSFNPIPIGPGSTIFVTLPQLDETMKGMATAVHEDFRKVGEGLRMHQELFHKFDEAHNAVTDLVETHSILIQMALEKLGLMDGDGNPSEEYQKWMANKRARFEAAKAQAQEAKAQEASTAASSPATASA
jgi:antirestriction protein ArdC